MDYGFDQQIMNEGYDSDEIFARYEYFDRKLR